MVCIRLVLVYVEGGNGWVVTCVWREVRDECDYCSG